MKRSFAVQAISRPEFLRAELVVAIVSLTIGGLAMADEPAVDSVVVEGQETINYAMESDSANYYSTAGFVRFLEDNTASPVSAPLENSEVLNQKDAVVASPSPYSLFSTGPITLAPLKTPSTVTKGIGTGALPQDMVSGRLPPAIALPTGGTRVTPPASATKTWIPGGFCHQPLYWENPMLERHGHQACPALQPVISGTRFYGTFLILPYLATLRDPLDDVHTLGAYRPGSPAPALLYRPRYDLRALRNEVIMSGAATAISAP